MKKLYSYSRVSSLNQKDGFGLGRQKDNAEAYAKKHGYQLVELIDAGVSGFKPDKNNINQGELGRFIQAIQDGQIEKGSILLIENLDRLGRHGITKTQMIVGNIISGGVEIHVWNGGDTKPDIYSEETMNEIGPAVMLAVHAESAYKQSKEKQDRTTNNWIKRKQAIKDGKLLTKRVPNWLVVEDDEIILPDENRDLIDQIVSMYLDEDLGVNSIIKRLKSEGVESFYPTWHTGCFNQMLRSPALKGELHLKEGTVYKDYFPPAVDEDTFNRIQLKIKQRSSKFRRTGGSSHNTKNLFRGLCKCGVCGSNMNLRSVTSSGKKSAFLRCKNQGCKNGGWNIVDFEPAFFKWVKGIDLDAVFQGNGEAKKVSNKIDAAKGKITQIEDQIKRLTKLGAMTDDIDEIASEINDLKEQRLETENHIDDLQVELSSQSVTDTNLSYDVAELNEEQRAALRTKLHTLISEIQILARPHSYGSKDKSFMVLWKNGRFDKASLGDSEIIWGKKDGIVRVEKIIGWSINAEE